ncbi:MAG: hypothetical protein ROO71_13215 [Balneola sp.]
MRVIVKVVSVFILFLLFNPTLIHGQSSLVPSYHPVYEWLYLQRVKGYLPYYDYESLPLNRKVILDHLKELSESDQYQTGKEEQTLDSFLQEFDPEHLNRDYTHSLITNDSRLSFDRFKDWAWSDGEKHMYSYADSSGFLVFDHGFGRGGMFVQDGSKNRNAPYILNQHWRTYGGYKNSIGYHIEYIRAVPVGDQRIFEYDGFYSYNWKSLTPSQNQINNYHYEAYVTAQHSLFEASIGRGNLKEGVGQSENLALSRSSIPFDWVKLRVGKKKIRYSFTHGTLSWPAVNATLPGDSTVSTRTSPRRWLTYHKITVQPSSRITFAAYEIINYANRGAEIAYINPINRYAFAEWELQDQDNGWFGVYLIARPFNFLEAHTELLIDDLGHRSDIISKKKFPRTSKFGRRYGLNIASKTGVQFWGEYTRIDPFFYSHPRDLNTYTDKGIGLGSQIGPNADRLEGGIKAWGVGRTFLSLSYSYNRQGLDKFDENGNKIFLAGASVLDSRDENTPKSYLFLDGDLHEWHRFLVKGSFEPKRGYIFDLNLDIQKMIKGNQLDDLAILWVDFTFGF